MPSIFLHRAKDRIWRFFVRAQNRVLIERAKAIGVARQQRAMESSLDYIEKHLPYVESVRTRHELIVNSFKRADVSGDRQILEFGVWMGDSLNLIAKHAGKTVFGFDSFEGLPESWGGDLWKKGNFAVSSLPKVRGNVVLVKGWFNETLPEFLEKHSGDIGFLHVDSDLYSSCKTVLDLLQPRLMAGTVIVFDDYFNFPQWQEGEAKAFHEFMERTHMSCEFIGYNRSGEQLAVILREKK